VKETVLGARPDEGDADPVAESVHTATVPVLINRLPPAVTVRVQVFVPVEV
jgi:hypothetical protein